METGRQVLLDAFDRLFDRAAAKLNIAYTPEERSEIARQFEERFARMFDTLGSLPIDSMPPAVMGQMEEAIDSLSPAQVVGHLAAIPLVHQAQQMLHFLTQRAAQQKMIEYALSNADDRYGGS